MVESRMRHRDIGGASKFVFDSNTRPEAFPFSLIDAGEVDANAEHVLALRRQIEPTYIGAYTKPPNFQIEAFVSGEKHIILGQKGTGKTAVLRNIEARLKNVGWKTEYIIFRDTILEENELANIPFDLVIEKEKFRNSTFYHHALKRLLICVFLKLVGAHESSPPTSFAHSLDARVAELSLHCLQTPVDGQTSFVAESLSVDVSRVTDLLGLTRQPNDSDTIRVLKSLNDRLLNLLCMRLRESKDRVAVFVDELHFSYAADEALRDDAALVRDAILALMTINDRMARENLPASVFSGVRSEYLTHPVISQSEVTTRLESVGDRLGWETVQIRDEHPLFEMAVNRIAIGMLRHGVQEHKVRKIAESLVTRLFSNGPKVEFLRQTWTKPRDLVRFLKVASKFYSDRTTLVRSEFSSTMREVAIESWAELKSALSSFFTSSGLDALEAYISDVASQSLERDGFCSYEDFERAIQRCIANSAGASLTHTMRMLYMIGLFTTVRKRSEQEPIRHSYHRGQPSPDRSGDVSLHCLVAKAFS